VASAPANIRARGSGCQRRTRSCPGLRSHRSFQTRLSPRRPFRGGGESVTSRAHPALQLPEQLPAGGRRLTLLQRCAIALLLAMLALAAQALLRRYLDGAYYPVYLAAVAVSAWLGGLVPGLLPAAVTTAGAFVPAAGLAAGDWVMSLVTGGGVAVLVAFLLAARRRAERSAARAGRIHALNQALGPGLSPDEVARAVVEHAVDALQAGGGAVSLGGERGLLHAEGSLRGAEPTALTADVLQDGVPRFHSDATGATAALPLLTSTRPLGVLELRFPYRRRFGRDDRAYMLALAGIGLLVSAASVTQQQAFLGSFIATVPLMLLSGYASPIDNMPHWLQILTYADPIRYFLIIVQGLFLKTMPASVVFAQTWPLLVIATVSLSAAAWLFRARME